MNLPSSIPSISTNHQSHHILHHELPITSHITSSTTNHITYCIINYQPAEIQLQYIINYHSHHTFHQLTFQGFDGSTMKEITGFIIKMLTLLDGLLSPLIYCCTNATFHNERRQIIQRFTIALATAGREISKLLERIYSNRNSKESHAERCHITDCTDLTQYHVVMYETSL